MPTTQRMPKKYARIITVSTKECKQHSSTREERLTVVSVLRGVQFMGLQSLKMLSSTRLIGSAIPTTQKKDEIAKSGNVIFDEIDW